MNPGTFLELLYNVLTSTIPIVVLKLLAVWIAGRIVLNNLSLLQNNVSSNRAIQLIIWLALGEILTQPLIDLLALAQLFTTFSFENGEAYTLWGNVPAFIYDLCVVFILLFIYGITLITGWMPFFKRVPPILESIQLSPFERIFSLFTIAGLVNHAIRSVLTGIIWFQGSAGPVSFGKGIAGFFAGWLTGLLIVGIAIYVMSELIAKKEEESLETVE